MPSKIQGLPLDADMEEDMSHIRDLSRSQKRRSTLSKGKLGEISLENVF